MSEGQRLRLLFNTYFKTNIPNADGATVCKAMADHLAARISQDKKDVFQ